MPAPPPTTEAGGASGGSSTHQRRDIQGLRAVAVLMVVTFHAGLPVPGGFVGVDVFFVISGFVITAMLQREWLQTGRIRFGRFYLRRFKRLTPALALMIAATLVLAALILSPVGTQETAAQTAVGAMLLLANLVIARTTGGYFDAPAETNPLLNTWSLSVEEQFYIAFPAVLALSWVVARRRSWFRLVPITLIGALAASSFWLAVAGSRGYVFPTPSWIVGPWLTGFYSPLTRAWEFAAGALLALALAKRAVKAPRLLAGSGLVGGAMLAASLWLITASTPFPGTWTLLPVVGTLLLLLAGSHRDAPTTRALSSKPMVKVGDWSYSIYLWHWPWIVFAALLWPRSTAVTVIAALLALGPALASFYFVEQPIRLSPLQPTRRLLAVLAACATPLLLAGALLGFGETKTSDPNYSDTESFFAYLNEKWFPCPPSVAKEVNASFEGLKRCYQSQPSGEYDVAVFGDSHAEHLFPGIAESLPGKNVVYLLSESPFVTSPTGAALVRLINTTPSLEAVVYAGMWDLGPQGSQTSGQDALNDTVDALRSPGRRLVLVGDIPEFDFQGFDCAFPAIVGPSRCAEEVPLSDVNYTRILRDLASGDDSLRVVDLRSIFCVDDLCRMNPDGTVLYRDFNHLNVEGSRIASRLLVPEILRSD